MKKKSPKKTAKYPVWSIRFFEPLFCKGFQTFILVFFDMFILVFCIFL